MLNYKDIQTIVDDIKKLTNQKYVKLYRYKVKNCPFVAFVLYHPTRLYVTNLLFKEHVAIIYFHLFHEFGHIYNGKKKSQITSEYLAEKFALKYMKKYFKMYYYTIINYRKSLLKQKKIKQKFLAYYKAFSKIKEYQ